MNIKLKLKPNFAFISIILFFISTPTMIALSFYALFSLNKDKIFENSNKINPNPTAQIFTALPDESPSTSIKLISSDARGEILKNYLSRFDSPLLPYAYYIVNMSDEYNIDFRLITAIAQQESNLCKYIPVNSHNCWGWGIHSQGTLGFSSYEEGIKTVSEGLKKEYLAKGYTTPEEIMRKYTPLSDGSWASGVSKFMQEME